MANLLPIEEVLNRLQQMADPENLKGMARFGINVEQAIGVSMPKLRKLAKELGKDHELALMLWNSQVHEARILASLIDEPVMVTREQMDSWAADFNSWDLCDQVTGNLFDKTPFAWEKAEEWSGAEPEFVKRAGFALMAWLAVHDKKASVEDFEEFFPLIEKAASDERNYVKKAVNWSLRQIGKRNMTLNREAIRCAERILEQDTKPGRWIARDALRELKGEKVFQMLNPATGKRKKKSA